MHSCRLVPIPTRESRRSDAPTVPAALPIMPTFGNSWAYFAIYWILLIVKELLGRRTR
jgi:hypothetical protein